MVLRWWSEETLYKSRDHQLELLKLAHHDAEQSVKSKYLHSLFGIYLPMLSQSLDNTCYDAVFFFFIQLAISRLFFGGRNDNTPCSVRQNESFRLFVPWSGPLCHVLMREGFSLSLFQQISFPRLMSCNKTTVLPLLSKRTGKNFVTCGFGVPAQCLHLYCSSFVGIWPKPSSLLILFFLSGPGWTCILCSCARIVQQRTSFFQVQKQQEAQNANRVVSHKSWNVILDKTPLYSFFPCSAFHFKYFDYCQVPVELHPHFTSANCLLLDQIFKGNTHNLLHFEFLCARKWDECLREKFSLCTMLKYIYSDKLAKKKGTLELLSNRTRFVTTLESPSQKNPKNLRIIILGRGVPTVSRKSSRRPPKLMTYFSVSYLATVICIQKRRRKETYWCNFIGKHVTKFPQRWINTTYMSLLDFCIWLDEHLACHCECYNNSISPISTVGISAHEAIIGGKSQLQSLPKTRLACFLWSSFLSVVQGRV